MANLIAKSIDSAEQLNQFAPDPNNELVQEGRRLAYGPRQSDQSADPAPLAGTTAFASSDNPTGSDSSNLSCGNGQRVNPVSGSEVNTVAQEKREDEFQKTYSIMQKEDARLAIYDNSPATPSQLAHIDRDIAFFQEKYPNSPELVRLLQLRAQRGNELAAAGTNNTA